MHTTHSNKRDSEFTEVFRCLPLQKTFSSAKRAGHWETQEPSKASPSTFRSRLAGHAVHLQEKCEITGIVTRENKIMTTAQ